MGSRGSMLKQHEYRLLGAQVRLLKRQRIFLTKSINRDTILRNYNLQSNFHYEQIT
jgi:hypothetical protein